MNWHVGVLGYGVSPCAVASRALWSQVVGAACRRAVAISLRRLCRLIASLGIDDVSFVFSVSVLARPPESQHPAGASRLEPSSFLSGPQRVMLYRIHQLADAVNVS